MNKKLLVSISYLLAALFAVLAVYYFLTPADNLAHFMPGYSSSITAVHLKHGVACLALAVLCGAFGWFQGGPKKSPKQED